MRSRSRSRAHTHLHARREHCRAALGALPRLGRHRRGDLAVDVLAVGGAVARAHAEGGERVVLAEAHALRARRRQRRAQL